MPWTDARGCQAPLCMDFSRDLPNPVIKPRSPTLQVDSLQTGPPGKPIVCAQKAATNRRNVNPFPEVFFCSIEKQGLQKGREKH